MFRIVLLAARLGLRWLALPWPARQLARRVVHRATRASVSRATAELEATASERLPKPVAEAVLALPPGIRTAGGSALVATRAARTAGATATATTRTVRTVRGTSRRLGHRLGAGYQRVGTLPGDLRAQTGAEVAAATRRLRSRYLAATIGPEAATDALLDARPLPGPTVDPHAATPPPVQPGRRQTRRERPRLPDRPSRTYRRPSQPWD